MIFSYVYHTGGVRESGDRHASPGLPVSHPTSRSTSRPVCCHRPAAPGFRAVTRLLAAGGLVVATAGRGWAAPGEGAPTPSAVTLSEISVVPAASPVIPATDGPGASAGYVGGVTGIGGALLSVDAASAGVIGGAVLNARPVTRPGEVLEAVPGMIVTQHSGEGKANQYFLRGFNLDHGTDIAISVDGMPVNMRTHAHGQGYADLNFLIPELVGAVEYHKGP